MKVLGVSVKQVVVETEFTPKDLLYLHWFLNKSSIEFNGEDEFEKAAVEYVSEKLFPTLVELLKDLKDGPG